jgi:hypothetical protein
MVAVFAQQKTQITSKRFKRSELSVNSTFQRIAWLRTKAPPIAGAFSAAKPVECMDRQ